MRGFAQFISEDFTVEAITYDDYCLVLDNLAEGRNLSEGVLSKVAGGIGAAASKIASGVAAVFGPLKDELVKIATMAKAGLAEIVQAMKNPTIFSLLQAVRFNLSLLVKAIGEMGRIYREGLGRIFQELAKNRLIQQVRAGTLKIDQILNRYPLLKKISGPAIAGLLLYIWLNMSFIGNAEYDLNLSSMLLALSGKFSITDLFVSPEGLMMLTLFATGGIISAPWLGASTANLLLALLYTGLKKAKGSPQLLSRIKGMLK